MTRAVRPTGGLRRWLVVLLGAGGVLCNCFAVADFGDFDTTRATVDAASAPDDASGAAVAITVVGPVVVHRGATATFNVTIARLRPVGALTIEVAGLPSGVSTTPVVVSADAIVAPLTVRVEITAAAGSFSVVVRATPASGAAGAAQAVAIDVVETRLDPSYGDGGIAFGTLDTRPEDFAVDALGRPLIAGYTKRDGSTNHRVVWRDDGAGRFDAILDDVVDAPAPFLIASAPNGDLIVVVPSGTEETVVVDVAPGAGQPRWQAFLTATIAATVPVVRVGPDGSVYIFGNRALSDGTHPLFFYHVRPDGLFVGNEFGDGVVGGPTGDDFVDTADDAVVTTDGVVLCSRRSLAGGGATADLRFRHVRGDGTFDFSFGEGGILAFGPDLLASVECNGLVPAGAGVVALLTSTNQTNQHVDLLAIRSVVDGGALDPAFGAGGVAALPLSSAAAGVALARAEPAGGLYALVSDGSSSLLARRADGALEPGFGGHGAGRIDVGRDVGGEATPRLVRVRPDGSLVVIGERTVSDTPGWFVARYLP